MWLYVNSDLYLKKLGFFILGQVRHKTSHLKDST